MQDPGTTYKARTEYRVARIFGFHPHFKPFK